VAQQALCNALGASGLHWVWAIDAASGPRLRFVRAHRAVFRNVSAACGDGRSAL